jgi:hypothetical protein
VSGRNGFHATILVVLVHPGRRSRLGN